MHNLPIYLQKKLAYLGINSIADLQKENYLRVFAWLRDKYQGISYKTLYDLFCLTNNVELNSLSKLEKQNILDDYKQIGPCYTPVAVDTIIKYLDLANKQAEFAFNNNEIPIGAVIVKDGLVIASSYNQTQLNNNVILHAEINVINEAQKILGTTRLVDCDLYVNIEPCLMCSGAIVLSRLKRLFFGARELKTGAALSQYQVFVNKMVNHHTEIIGPVD